MPATGRAHSVRLEAKSDQIQSAAFLHAAKEHGIDLDESKLKEALRKIAKHEKKEDHRNDAT